MRKILTAAALLLLTGSAALAGAKEDMLAADRAFSDMSVKNGAHAAFLRFHDGRCASLRRRSSADPRQGGRGGVLRRRREKENPDGEKNSRLEWTPLEAEASPDGVLGWTRGTWIYSGTKKDGTKQKVTGYYITGWKRQTDGKYKFVLDIGGEDGP